ncbi:sensor histidine kinase [Paucidesulfovibrio longus]|uniref:sensor histidine kinase n=1 Tax=Paucidesulfovibrio longus TaxID=889 RepID=UPI0003B46575|nr:MASE3 domain-containing protein [Paucidesulfovibrio longus]
MANQATTTSATSQNSEKFIFPWAIAGAGLAALFVVSRYNYLLFHTLAELFSIAVAWAAFVVAWNSRERLQRGYLLILGVALLCVGFVDLLHTVAYKGMGVFGKDQANLPTQLWIAGRYLKSFSFLLATAYLTRPARPAPLLSGFALATSALLLLIFLGWFPDCFVEGSGLTPFKIYSEYAVCVLMLLSGWIFHRHRSSLDPVLLRLLLGSIALTVVQELFFTFYVSVYGLSNLLGHFSKIGAYFLIYLGVVRTGVAEPQRLLYRSLQESREHLARSEARLNDAQRIAGAGSWEWSADNGKIIWSAQMYALFGLHPANFTPNSENLRALLGAEAWTDYMRGLARCLKIDDACEFETAVRLPESGEVRHMEISCRAERNGGKRPVRILGMVRDITRRKRMESMREDVERILHHDLKSPVASLVSSLQLLNTSKDIPSEYREMLAAMERSAERVLALVDRSLTLRKIEEGNFTPGEEPVNLVSLLGQIRRETQRFQDRKGILFALHVAGAAEGGKRPDTRGDSALLLSMLSNLVNNALEAAPEGSTVTVTVTNPEAPTITIHNLGTVPEEVRQRFFEKYATFGKHSGTGLGTYSAKLIAEAHGGSVQMRTSDENGTTLTVRLPGLNS